MDIFRSLSVGQKREVLLQISKHLKFDIVTKLNKEELVVILEHMDTDEATDILQLLSAKKRKSIMNELNEQLKADISMLLKFDPETAAGLMDIDYIQVEHTDTIASVAKQVKVHEKRTGKIPAILVIKDGKLEGYLPGHELGYAGTREKVIKHTRKIKTIRYQAKTTEILDTFRRYPHNKMVVLGDTGNIMGIIYSDDIIKILREKEAASLYDFAGVSQEESVFDTTKRKIEFRYKWLIINLGTAFLAAFTVGLFDEVISK